MNEIVEVGTAKMTLGFTSKVIRKVTHVVNAVYRALLVPTSAVSSLVFIENMRSNAPNMNFIEGVQVPAATIG